MENQGKVTKLVNRYNNKTYIKKGPPKVDKALNKEKEEIKPVSQNKTPDQDEISVTIDIEEDEPIAPGANRPQVKTRSKRNLQSPVNKPIGDESATSNPPNASKPDPSNQIISQPNGKGQVKDDSSRLSPWLSDRLNNIPQEAQSSKNRAVATDTFELDRFQDEELRLLKENLDDLECQTRIKDREIETLKWIENEMHKRLQTTGDVLSLKQKVKDLQRNLDLQERLNHDLTKDNARIYDEMSYKDRKIMELQSEVNNLDRIVASKTYFEDSENHQQNLNQIDNLQRELLEKGFELKENEQKINNLMRELDKKEKEISLKNMKLEDMNAESSQYQQEIISQERKQYELMEALKSKEKENEKLNQNVRKADDYERKWENLEDENLFLKQSLHELEEQCKDLERRQTTSHDMNSTLEELRIATSDKNHLQEENLRLQEQLRTVESMLKENKIEEMALEKENSQLKAFIVDLEEENGLYRKFENDVNDLDAQLRDSEKARNALENQIVQLKPEIQRLQVKSLEKDHLILQLVQELKAQVGYLPADLRNEISKNEADVLAKSENIPTREKFV